MIDSLKSEFIEMNYVWKSAAVLLFSASIILTLTFVYWHQWANIWGMFSGSLMLTVLIYFGLSLVMKVFYIDLPSTMNSSKWCLLGMFSYVLLAPFMVSAGFDTYQAKKLFEGKEKVILNEISSGKSDSRRELSILYLQEYARIPNVYDSELIRKKGAAIFDKWLTEKLASSTAGNYVKDMRYLASQVYRSDENLHIKWLSYASQYGDKEAELLLRRIKHEKYLKKQKALKTANERNEPPLSFKSFGVAVGKAKQKIKDASKPIKDAWEEFKDGISKGEREVR